MATKYGWEFGVRILAGARVFLFSKTANTNSGALSDSYSMGTVVLSWG
jgi:hypothetical protein